jgi:zinc/manganese transport system substrate-binding protein
MRLYTKSIVILSAVVLAVLVCILLMQNSVKQSNDGKVIQIVAAENFWGSLASQLGGNRVHVLSIVSDPNADPHEYESNSVDARSVATANFVILNGIGYDTWANQLLNASVNKNRTVLTIGNLVGKKAGDNPHLWYDPAYVNRAIIQIDQDLISIDPVHKSYFQKQLANLQSSLSTYQNRIKSIKKQFGGEKVASTEDIFAYLASASGLDLISPSSFTEAVAEGNDPPTGSIVEFQQQLESEQVKVLVYNEQTVTPLTSSIKTIAAENNIPIVGVTETIQPPDTSFQVWMNAELLQLQNALNAEALGKS